MAKPTSGEDSLPIGKRIYENLKPGEPQPLLNAVVAVVTLTLYGECM
jgi:hypothetical protein